MSLAMVVDNDVRPWLICVLQPTALFDIEQPRKL